MKKWKKLLLEITKHMMKLKIQIFISKTKILFNNLKYYNSICCVFCACFVQRPLKLTIAVNMNPTEKQQPEK